MLGGRFFDFPPSTKLSIRLALADPEHHGRSVWFEIVMQAVKTLFGAGWGGQDDIPSCHIFHDLQQTLSTSSVSKQNDREAERWSFRRMIEKQEAER